MRIRIPFPVVLLGGIMLSGCSSVTYRENPAQSEFLEIRGGRKSRLGKQGSWNTVNDIVGGWHIRKDFESFSVRLKAKFIDQDGRPITDFPLEVELEGSPRLEIALKELNELWLVSDSRELPTSTFAKRLSFRIVNDWRRTLAEKGEAVELTPGSIEALLKCEKGICRIDPVPGDQGPSSALTFRVQRIAHVDEPQKAAYARQIALAEAEHLRKQSEAQEAQEREQKEIFWRREHREQARFGSFEEARKYLSSPLGDEAAYSLFISFVREPMSLKGQVIVVRAKIVQAIDRGQFLMTNFPSVSQMFPGADMIQDGFYMGVVTPKYDGDLDFVDGQIVDIVAEVTDTTQYVTALQSKKTVARMRIYGIRPNKG